MIACVLAGFLAALLGLTLFAADPNREYAVVAGTVFRENGFSFPGAAVSLSVKDNPKIKPLRAVSSPRGEFAFRVSGAGTYVVRAVMKGFEPAEKEVVISAAGERNEVTLILAAESK